MVTTENVKKMLVFFGDKNLKAQNTKDGHDLGYYQEIADNYSPTDEDRKNANVIYKSKIIPIGWKTEQVSVAMALLLDKPIVSSIFMFDNHKLSWDATVVSVRKNTRKSAQIGFTLSDAEVKKTLDEVYKSIEPEVKKGIWLEIGIAIKDGCIPMINEKTRYVDDKYCIASGFSSCLKEDGFRFVEIENHSHNSPHPNISNVLADLAKLAKNL